MSAGEVVLRALTKRFDDAVAVDGIDLTIEPTTLRMVGRVLARLGPAPAAAA
jgi:hypothetical protein